MQSKSNKLFSLLLVSSALNATNISYTYHDIHTMTPKKDEVNLGYSYLLLNDTVDLLNIKESEFGNSARFDSIGDMKGHELKLRYALSDDLMISYKYARHSIEYGDSSLKNSVNDIYIRHNFYKPKKKNFSGFSYDFGYVQNKLDDFHLTNTTEINDLARKVTSSTKYTVNVAGENNPLYNPGAYYLSDGKGTNSLLNDKPYVSLEDTQDDSFYMRFLTGFYVDNFVSDFYVGYKKTKIKNKISANDELIKEAKAQGFNIAKSLDRDEQMFFMGFNLTYEQKSKIIEFGYEYEKFKRDSGLDYIDFNHIIDLTTGYKYDENTLFFIGGKIMYRQFNGQIPYLYNQYSQTTYDHKYGYAKLGLQYRF